MLSVNKSGAAMRREIARVAKERNVRYLRLAFVDIAGLEKSVSIPVGELDRALEGRVSFDGGSIDGFARGEEIDMLLAPDPSTFAVLPWTPPSGTEARILCDIRLPDGSAFEGCPRTTLRRVLDDASGQIAGVQSALEIEFYLFDRAPDGEPTTHTSDAGSYFDFSPSDRGDETRTAIVAALEAMGIAVASAHHEHGAGQHEIDLAPRAPLATADAFVTVRSVVKQIAARAGLHATFMPKPLETQAGSGLHVYLQMGDAGEDIRLHAIAGLLEHAPGFTAICNPTINSYKRLVAAWDAPVYTVWSHRSANSLVRIPSASDGRVEIEIRSPDATCNPYLAFAVLAESAADGIRRHRLPGDPFTGSTYQIEARYRDEHGIRKLPRSLHTALEALDADAVVRGALGDHIYHAFRDAKFAEYERYRRAIHPWEHEAYLRTF